MTWRHWIRCDSQDLASHTVMSDGSPLSGRPLGGANKRRTLALSPGYINYPHLVLIKPVLVQGISLPVCPLCRWGLILGRQSRPRSVLSTAISRSSKGRSLGRGQAHLAYDGLIARIAVQEVIIWTALNAYQPGCTFLVRLLEVVECFFFLSQACVNVGDLER